MKKKVNNHLDAAQLRRRAEEQLKENKTAVIKPRKLEDLQRLVHELQVHQIELELQNEEIKRAKDAVEEILQKYTDLYDFAPVGYFTLSEQGLILEANLSAAGLLGVSRSTLVNQPLTRFILSEDQDIYYRHRKQIFETGTPQVCELRMLREDTPSFWARLAATAAQDADGVPVCRAVMSDITERKLAEAELVRLAAAIDQVRETVMILSTDGVIQYMNRAVELLTGKTREELTGHKIPIDERYIDQYRQAWEIVTAGETWTGAITETKADGSGYDLNLTITPVHDEKGSIAGVVSIGRDVTRERQLEEHLRQSHKMEAIGTLAGGVAHDFNNILAGMIGLVEIAKDSVPPASAIQCQLDQVLALGERAANLVRQILAFTRKMPVQCRPLQLSQVIREGLELLRPIIPATVKIREKILDDKIMVIADLTQMHQMLINLCTNAAHALQEKGGVLEVELARVSLNAEEIKLYTDIEPGNYVKLQIRDTGTGIDPAIISRIFDPFFTTKEMGTGTGMGLAVVYGIVKGHGGDIRVESEVGRGTTCTVLLPCIIMEPPLQAGQETPLQKGNERILFIDDEPYIIDSNRYMLESLGYAVTATNSAIEALEMFRADSAGFDLVITDMTMPHMNGYDLAQKLMQIRTDIPVILCTGYSEIVSKEKALGIGIHDFIMKPIRKREMAEVIRKVLDNKSA